MENKSELDVKKLVKEIQELKIQLNKLYLDLKLGVLKDFTKIKKTKKEIAQKLTKINNQITV